MWDTPFDPSILDGIGVVVHCPEESFVNELMDTLAKNGVKWCDGTTPTVENSCWNMEKKNTVYYIDRYKRMTWGDINCLTEYGYMKCTFYGVESADFDVASDDELQALFGIGGV